MAGRRRAVGLADGPATAYCLTQSLCCGNFEGLGDSDREFTNNEPSYMEQALVLWHQTFLGPRSVSWKVYLRRN